MTAIFLLLLTSAFAQESDFPRLTVKDMGNYHFAIHGPMQDKFPDGASAYARDMNWVARNSAKVDQVRKSGKKVNCYINWGRLQANPNKNSELAFGGIYKHYATLIPKRGNQYDLAGRTCTSEGDKWGEPWWNLKQQYRPQLLKAWGAMFAEANKHCDGVELDNPDVYEHVKDGSCGSRRDSVEMMKEVCKLAHQSKLNCVLRNMFDDAQELAPYVDAAVGEQCFSWGSSGNSRPPNFSAYSKAFGKRKPSVCIEYANMDVENDVGGIYQRNFSQDCQSASAAGVTLIVEKRQSVQGDPKYSCAGTSMTAQETTTQTEDASGGMR